MPSDAGAGERRGNERVVERDDAQPGQHRERKTRRSSAAESFLNFLWADETASTSTPTSDASSASGADVGFMDVVLDAAPYPFTKANFRAFLEKEQAQENLDFLCEVLLFRQVAECVLHRARDGKVRLIPMDDVHPALVARFRQKVARLGIDVPASAWPKSTSSSKSLLASSSPRSPPVSARHSTGAGSATTTPTTTTTSAPHFPGPWGDDDTWLLEDGPPTEWAWALSLIRKWIGPEATVAQINLSEQMSSDLLRHAHSNPNAALCDAPLPDFGPSTREVVAMLRSSDRWGRFYRAMRTTNITESEASFRFASGFAGLILTVVFGLLLRYLAMPAGLPRYGVAVLLLPSAWFGCYFTLSSQTRVCLGRAAGGAAMPQNITWQKTRAFDGSLVSLLRKTWFDGRECDVGIDDARTKRALQVRGVRDATVTSLLAGSLVALLAATPP